MAFEAECLYFLNCSKTYEQCVKCKLKDHTDINEHIRAALQWEFDVKLKIYDCSMYLEMLQCLNSGGNNDDIANILNDERRW